MRFLILGGTHFRGAKGDTGGALPAQSCSRVLQLVSKASDDLGVLARDVAGFAGIGLEVVELGLGGIAELGVGRDVLSWAVRSRDELPFALTHGKAAGVFDQCLAADRVFAEERGEMVAAIEACRDGSGRAGQGGEGREEINLADESL